jgi:hypothetical protein
MKIGQVIAFVPGGLTQARPRVLSALVGRPATISADTKELQGVVLYLKSLLSQDTIFPIFNRTIPKSLYFTALKTYQMMMMTSKIVR